MAQTFQEFQDILNRFRQVAPDMQDRAPASIDQGDLFSPENVDQTYKNTEDLKKSFSMPEESAPDSSKFELGKSSETSKPMSRTEIEKFKLDNALKKNRGVMVEEQPKVATPETPVVPESPSMTPESMEPLEQVQPKIGDVSKGMSSQLKSNLTGPMGIAALATIAPQLMSGTTGEDTKKALAAYDYAHPDMSTTPQSPFNLSTPDLLTKNSSDIKDLPPAQEKPEQPTGNIPPALAQMPAPLMNNPVKENIAEQTLPSEEAAPSKIEGLLNAYRSLASDQTTGLRDAQNRANQNEFYANLMKGLNLFNTGITGNKYTGSAKINNEALDSLLKSANKPVEQYKQQVEDQKHDPSSRYSQMMRQYLAPKLVAQGVDVNSPEFRNTPADVLEKIAPHIASEAKAKLMTEYKNAVLGAKFEAAKQKGEEKAQEHSDKAYTDLTQKYNSFRGNQEVQQSALSIRNAKNALALAERGALSPEQQQMLASEIARIAIGGVPTESGIKHLVPDNLQNRTAKFVSFLNSKPTPVELTEYMKQNKEYLNDLTNISEKIVNDYKSDIFRGYKGRISEENQKEFLQEHPELHSYYPDLVKQHGLGPKEQAKVNQKSDVKSVSKAELSAWSSKYKKTPEEAAAFFKKAGYQIQ